MRFAIASALSTLLLAALPGFAETTTVSSQTADGSTLNASGQTAAVPVALRRPLQAGKRFIFMLGTGQLLPSDGKSAALDAVGRQLKAEPQSRITLSAYNGAGEAASLPAQRLSALGNLLHRQFGVSSMPADQDSQPEPACRGGACVIVMLQSPDEYAGTLDLASLQKQAVAGDGAAQYQLSRRYFDGRGVAADSAAGWRWMSAALEQSDTAAITELAWHVQGRTSLPYDADALDRYFSRAIRKGCIKGYYGLGALYEGGVYHGRDRDALKAAQNYQAGAEAGDGDSAYHLAAMYNYTNHDYDSVIHWLKQGAGNGSWISAAALSLFYENGSGVAQDTAEAMRWQQQAITLRGGRRLSDEEQDGIARTFNLGVSEQLRALSEHKPGHTGAPASPEQPPADTADLTTFDTSGRAFSFKSASGLSGSACMLAYGGGGGSGASVCSAPH